MTKVGVVGASGFAGSELLRLAAAHPELEVVWATGDSQAGTPIADLYPSLAAVHPEESFATYSPELLGEIELVVVALPHGASQPVVAAAVEAGLPVIDLGADFRHADPAVYEEWYGERHTRPDLVDRFVYGLPERYRDDIADAAAVAAPGCYPTAAILTLAPALDAGLVESGGIVVDAASGVSGAGRALKAATAFCTVDEDFTAYGLLTHRHTPEIEAHTGAQVLFTPHLAPMNRGILVTAYGRLRDPATSTEEALSAYASAYADEPFVVVSERIPSTKATLGSNCAHLTVRADARTGTLVAIGAIDNLVKGTAGQAVQCANLMFGRPETTGLPIVGMAP